MTRRERAIEAGRQIIADGLGCHRICSLERMDETDPWCGCRDDAEKVISEYERVMGETDEVAS